jgi:hypothetical protein
MQQDKRGSRSLIVVSAEGLTESKLNEHGGGDASREDTGLRDGGTARMDSIQLRQTPWRGEAVVALTGEGGPPGWQGAKRAGWQCPRVGRSSWSCKVTTASERSSSADGAAALWSGGGGSWMTMDGNAMT